MASGAVPMLTVPLILALAVQTPVMPLDPKNAFPFVIPWDDATKGTATDVSFLNAKPAGKNGRILVKNGRFVEEKSGRRIRFFGTNLGADAAFPAKEDADRIAAHMAKMGINLVRLHHLNNGWGVETGGSIWKKGRAFIEMDPVQIDKLDFFVAALKKQGIFVNLNLQTSREYIPELGLPESVRQIPSFQKKVDKYYERMIELQQEYARQLLDRTNPHTGLRYADDPVVAKIEINNENSLVGWPGESPGSGLTGFPEPFVGDLRARWHAWLKKTYGTDAGIRAAWTGGGDPLGASIVSRANHWTHENQSSGDIAIAEVPETGTADSPNTLRASIRSNGGPDWHVQAHINGLDLKNGAIYTVTFRAKADRPMTVGVGARLDQADWHFLGLGASADVTTQWKDYAFSFRAIGTEPHHARISLVLGAARGSLEIERFRVRLGSMSTGLDLEESLAKENVTIPTPSLSPRFRDYTRFLTELESAFSNRMRDFLRKDLGFKYTNIIDTQTSWGGLTSLYRERAMEYADNHEYWNHPVFLGGDWDPKNYRVERKALVNELSAKFGTLGNLAQYRVAGKPYSVSEYNHPAPSDYQVEMMPLYATFAAYQDWDAIYTFAWEATGSRSRNDRYDGYFDMARNPAKAAFFPAAALTFRLGLVPPAEGSRTLVVPERPWEPALAPGEAWSQLDQTPDPLRERVEVKWDPSAKVLSAVRVPAPSTTLRSAGTPGAGVYIADSARSVAVSGFVGGKSFVTQAGSFTFGKLPTQFASLMVVPLDGLAFGKSKRILVTLGSRVENPGMDWNEARTSVSDRWGDGPTMAERVPVEIALKVGKNYTVYALSPTGKRLGAVKTLQNLGTVRFSTKNTSSMWFEVVKK